jgi:hypothetical protein
MNIETAIAFIVTLTALVGAITVLLNKLTELSRASKKLKQEFNNIEGKVNRQEERTDNQEKKVKEQEQLIAEQQKIINDLVVFQMASFLFEHLKNIYHAQKTGGEYLFHRNNNFIKDLQYLRDNGFIEIFGIRQLPDGQNLAEAVKLTENGEKYVELRERFKRE